MFKPSTLPSRFVGSSFMKKIWLELLIENIKEINSLYRRIVTNPYTYAYNPHFLTEHSLLHLTRELTSMLDNYVHELSARELKEAWELSRSIINYYEFQIEGIRDSIDKAQCMRDQRGYDTEAEYVAEALKEILTIHGGLDTINDVKNYIAEEDNVEKYRSVYYRVYKHVDGNVENKDMWTYGLELPDPRTNKDGLVVMAVQSLLRDPVVNPRKFLD